MQTSLPCSSAKKHISEEEEKKNLVNVVLHPFTQFSLFCNSHIYKTERRFFFSSLIIKIQGEKRKESLLYSSGRTSKKMGRRTEKLKL